MSQPSFDFSIIIPTYNRPARLKQCLQSIVQIDYPCDRFEVIVVDDGSNVPLNDAIAPFYKSLHITLVTQSNAGPATARNRGANIAKGRVLAFTDDDCQPSPDWLTALVDYFFGHTRATKTGYIVGGKVLNLLTQNLYSTASQLLVDYLYTQCNADPTDAGFFTSNNLALLAADFRACGGFNETFPLAAGEDREFCDRLKSKGYKLIYATQAIVFHTHELTLRSFWRQQFNYGRGAFHFHRYSTQRHEQQKNQTQPWMFYLNLLLYPFHEQSLLIALPIALLFLVSQIAIAVGLTVEFIQYMTHRSLKQSRRIKDYKNQ